MLNSSKERIVVNEKNFTTNFGLHFSPFLNKLELYVLTTDSNFHSIDKRFYICPLNKHLK